MFPTYDIKILIVHVFVTDLLVAAYKIFYVTNLDINSLHTSYLSVGYKIPGIFLLYLSSNY
jgi:hypothetical protein